MPAPNYLYRHHRDRLMDLFPGSHYRPAIRNLPVSSQLPKVSYEDSTFIRIEHSQPDVEYKIRTNTSDRSSQGAIWWESSFYQGDGNTLKIPTEQLTKEAYTFSIYARKIGSGLESVLLQAITVEVGVDVSLPVRLLSAVIDYNTIATVIVENTQPNGDYQAFDPDEVALGDPVYSEEGGELEFPLFALEENMQVKIKSTNRRTGLNGWLAREVEVLVRPNPALTLLADGDHANALDEGIEEEINPFVYTYEHTALVTIRDSQSSAYYQLRHEWIDEDPIQTPPLNTPIVSALPGADGDLTIEIPPEQVREDFCLNVLAYKEDGPDGSIVEQLLDQKLTILVRPDPSKALGKEEIDGETFVKVHNTQPGVKYQLLDVTDPDHEVAVGYPRYHSRNFGVDDARMEREFGVDTFEADHVLLPTGPIEETKTYRVRATKVRTLLDTLLNQEITIAVN